MPHRRRVFRLANAETVSALWVMALTAVLTRRGLLIRGDSATYLKTARLFRSHPSRIFSPPNGSDLSIRGLFPPLYPIVLGFGGEGAMARLLAIVTAGITVFVLVRAVRTRSNPLVAVAVGLVVFANRAVLLVTFGFVLSDGVFLLFAVAAAAAFIGTISSYKPRRYRGLVLLASSFAALALAARYAGFGIVVGVAAAVALFGNAPRAVRLRWSALSFLIGVAPLAAWTAVISTSGDLGHRHLGVHPINGDLGGLFDTFGWFYLPRQIIDVVGAGTLAVLSMIAIGATFLWSLGRIWVGARANEDAVTARTTAALLTIGWAYFADLLATQILLDRQIGLGGRYAVPGLALIVAGVALDLHRRIISRASTASSRRWAAVAAGIVLVASPGLVRAALDPTEAWPNYTQLPPSKLLASLRSVPRGVVVYTNREDIVYLATGRPTARFPRHQDLYTYATNPQFRSRLRTIARQVDADRGVIVVWTDDPWGVSVPEIRRLTGLAMPYRNSEGALFVGVHS